jgi:hypothetical protein
MANLVHGGRRLGFGRQQIRRKIDRCRTGVASLANSAWEPNFIDHDQIIIRIHHRRSTHHLEWESQGVQKGSKRPEGGLQIGFKAAIRRKRDALLQDIGLQVEFFAGSWNPSRWLSVARDKIRATFLPDPSEVSPDFWAWWKLRLAHVRPACTFMWVVSNGCW